MADELMFDYESGDEGECDWGLYRAAENCPGGAAKYFEMPNDSRQEYRKYDRARAHHTRKLQQQQQPSEPEEEGDEMEWAEEAAAPQQQAEAEEEEEIDYDPGPPSPPPQPQSVHAEETHDDDDDTVPVKADGSYDRQAIWQRYRRIARRQLQEGGQSVKASAVNELARSLYREDGW
jgi:hypothetical protein